MIGFSVVIPNYNHSSFLMQRLDSVLSQTYPFFEVIILDDNSADNSRQIIDTYKGHDKISHIIYNKVNSGSPFLQWKKGIELAKYDWIWIAESDDFADPAFLEEAVKAISENTNAGIFYSDSFVVDENNHKIAERFSERKNNVFHTSKWSRPYFIKGIDEINEYLKFDCTINNISSVVFRKTLFTDTITLLDEFKYYGDWLFLLNASLSANICYSARPLNYYRRHSSSHLNSETSIITSRYEYFRILQLLYYNENVTEKKKLPGHFAYHYLSFGINNDGIRKGWQILQLYLKTDKRLAWKVIRRIAILKLFRQKRPFFVPGNESRK
jgi:glycosyltransferase involved in cell wall biosynthesis